MTREFLTKAELGAELDRLEGEVARWRNAHACVVTAKRQLSAKYGAIMRRKPAARWRRAKKRIKRNVTRITQKLRIR